MKRYTIAVHGGAGIIVRSTMTSDREKEYRQALADAVSAAEKILKAGGPALDAVFDTVAASL